VIKETTVMEVDMVKNRTLAVVTDTSLIVDTDIVTEAMATQARIPNTAEVTETIILVADTEITDIDLITVAGMDSKVTVHLHMEAIEYLTEAITPQVMEDTTRIARDTEVPLTEATSLEDMVGTEATNSEVMAVTEAISLEGMAVTEATSLEGMAATEATSLEGMAATEATSLEGMAVTEATSSEGMAVTEAINSEVMEATSPVEAMVTMNPIQPQAKKNTSQNEN